MYGLPLQYTDAIRAISLGKTFRQDVGKITYYESRVKQTRYMANVAGVGFDAYVNRRYNKLKAQKIYHKSLYLYSMIASVFRYSSSRYDIVVDGEKVWSGDLFTAAIGIGKYNGGGMRQIPEAIANDGLFDITVISKMNNFSVFRSIRSLYNDRVYKLKQSLHFRGRKIEITSSKNRNIEVDGEALGFAPFTFESIERSITVIVGEQFNVRH